MVDRRAVPVFWSFALFLGWLLSFPLHGPLLGTLAQASGGEGTALALSFTLFHGLGLAVAGLVLTPGLFRQAMEVSSLACLALSAAAYFSRPGLRIVWLGALGVASSFFLIGWSRPFVTIAQGQRLAFMAALTLVANVSLYLFNLLVRLLPPGLVFFFCALQLPLAFWFTRHLSPAAPPPPAAARPFPVKLLGLVCLLVLGLYVNGGLLYNVVYPAFLAFGKIDLYYQLAPYMVTLALLWALGKGARTRPLVYAGAALLGLGFVAFGLLGRSLTGFFLTETLILSAFALLDMFLWTLLADVSELHGHGFRIFGFALAVNLLALFLGGAVAPKLEAFGPAYPLLTGLLASGAVFATLVLLPVLQERAAADLAERVQERSAPADRSSLSSELTRCFPGAASLTDREREIVGLVVGGATNADIAGKLFISENTVKVHVKNINRKLAVANKYELLAALIRGQEGFAEAAATHSQPDER